MMLTFKVKHGKDFSRELILARKIAEYAIEHKSFSSADVKHFGLKSAIANQILRKYGRSKTIKEVKRVKLTIPSQGIKTDRKTISIACLKLSLPIYFDSGFQKINQVEIDGTFAFVSVSYVEPQKYEPKQIIGVDRNSTRHIIVASNITSGSVLKLGKTCQHIHQKYKHLRKRLQKAGKLRLVKTIKNRESRIVRNLNHHISKRLIKEAHDTQSVLVLENLKQIRQRAKCRRKQRYSLNSWSFYQLASMIEYKAKKLGVPIAYVEPQYTSQRCSKCGHIDRNNRKGNLFCCLKCGAVEDAGANAGFNIAHLFKEGIPRFSIDSDMLNGSTDTPREATL
jgi:putative transposase